MMIVVDLRFAGGVDGAYLLSLSLSLIPLVFANSGR